MVFPFQILSLIWISLIQNLSEQPSRVDSWIPKTDFSDFDISFSKTLTIQLPIISTETHTKYLNKEQDFAAFLQSAISKSYQFYYIIELTTSIVMFQFRLIRISDFSFTDYKAKVTNSAFIIGFATIFSSRQNSILNIFT